MILAKFRHRYPQGSLVSELIEIDRGTYIVKALVQIDNVILATGLAGAATVEAAEDAAKERAIATLFLDSQSNTPAASISETVPTKAPIQPSETKSLEMQPKVSSQNVNFSEVTAQPVEEDPGLAPITVPLKSVAATNESKSEPEATPPSEPESAPSSNLFGDTFTAPSPTLDLVVEDRSDSTVLEKDTTSEEIEAMGFNEIKQKTDIEIRRLNWTKDQGKEFLMSRYGKRSRLHLTDEQLLEFLRYLETLPNPVK